MGESAELPWTVEDAIAHEQGFVDRAYQILDENRTRYRRSQREVEAQGAWGTPQARTERDALAAHYGDQAMRLEQIEDRLVFGRIDTGAEETYYIGRTGLADEDGSRLLVDWRAPAALPFYQATAADPKGLVRRRHISTHLRKVRALEDELLDADLAREKGLRFQGEGALMSALSEAREGRMSDIVATIQAEQDAVIRAESKGIIVVQGGPGTGKTAVALHRAAYLLYQDRERLERAGVLVIGPSRVFLRYIEQVLPSLGETGVVSLTMGSLLPGLQTTLLDPTDVTAAKGDMAWVPTLRAAVRDLQRLPDRDVKLTFGARSAVLSREAVQAARTRARRSGRPHNQARDGFALELIEHLVKQLAGSDPDPDTLQWWREDVRGSREARREINLCWMPTKPTDLLERIYSRPALLERINRGLSGEQRELVARPKGSPWTVADVPLLDELEELLGYSQALRQQQDRQRQQQEEAEIERAQESLDNQQLGGGIVSAQVLADRAQGPRDLVPLAEKARADRSWAYGHIVVDEAQDLSPMGWHALLRRCPSLSFTVVGDLDQRRGPDRPTTWEKTLGPAARGLSEEFWLSISYRTPRSITELAQGVLAEIGDPVKFPIVSAREVEDALASTWVTGASDRELRLAVDETVLEELSWLDEVAGAGAGRIGVLLDERRAAAWGADLEGTASLDDRVSFLSVTAAKGLEFDTTILVEPAAVLAGGPGDLFVAMTRSTRRLHAVHTLPLPQVWEEALAAQGLRDTLADVKPLSG